MYYHRDHYILEGWLVHIKKYVLCGQATNPEWLKKLANKPYMCNYKRMRIRKITSETIWKINK